MRKSEKILYSEAELTITLREVLFSIVIVLIMLAAGFFISEKISSSADEQNQEYYQAIQIEDDTELFEYGMRTNTGNAFVAGTLEAVDPVSYVELDGSYAYIEKVKERYTEHERTVYEYDDDGNVIGEHKETYWTWDRIGSEEKHCTKINFCGVEFDYGTIPFPWNYYADTIEESYYIRYKYYVCDTQYDGIVYAKLNENSVQNAKFIEGKNTSQAREYLCSSSQAGVGWFWIVWLILTAFAVYVFYTIDNKWLED